MHQNQKPIRIGVIIRLEYHASYIVPLAQLYCYAVIFAFGELYCAFGTVILLRKFMGE